MAIDKEVNIIDEYYKVTVKGLTETVLEDKDLLYRYVLNLPDKLQITYTIAILHQQVFNGGFHQYFFNGYGQFAYITLGNLETIKAFKTANILNRALLNVNKEKYDIDEFRDKIFNRTLKAISDFDENLGDTLNDLDNEYYLLNEDLGQLLVDYLKLK